MSRESGLTAHQAELAMLGTALRQLGRDLLQAWNLGSIMQDSQEVALASKLSTVSPKGWTTPEAQRTTHAISLLLKQTDTDTLTRLQSNAEQATSLAQALGAHEAARSIPAAAKDSSPQASQTNDASALLVVADLPRVFPVPNPQQQVRALTEMGHVASSRKDLPMVLETCLEGMHRAVGLDRCVLCLLTHTRTQLIARMAAGPETTALRHRFQWNWTTELEARLKPQTAQWFTADAPGPNFLKQAGDSQDGFMATFTVDHKVIGMFYADCKPSGRTLTAEGFESFQCFVAQAEMVVRALP
ncbi:GAF domain-containing protein [Thiomonas sp.]